MAVRAQVAVAIACDRRPCRPGRDARLTVLRSAQSLTGSLHEHPAGASYGSPPCAAARTASAQPPLSETWWVALGAEPGVEGEGDDVSVLEAAVCVVAADAALQLQVLGNGVVELAAPCVAIADDVQVSGWGVKGSPAGRDWASSASARSRSWRTWWEWSPRATGRCFAAPKGWATSRSVRLGCRAGPAGRGRARGGGVPPGCRGGAGRG